MSPTQLSAGATAPAQTSVLHAVLREAPSVASSSGSRSLNDRLHSLGILASDGGLEPVGTLSARHTKVQVSRR
jgi:hypothetical protein